MVISYVYCIVGYDSLNWLKDIVYGLLNHTLN